MVKRSTPNSQDSATAIQAGSEQTLYDELHKGLNFAAKSLAAIDEHERLNLLSEAELACLNEQGNIPSESLIKQQLQQLSAPKFYFWLAVRSKFKTGQVLVRLVKSKWSI